MNLDTFHVVAITSFLGVLGAIGLYTRGKSWQWWKLSSTKECGLSLLGRLSLSPQSRAYLVDAEGVKILVVVCGSSVAMQAIGGSPDRRPFQQVFEVAQR